MIWEAEGKFFIYMHLFKKTKQNKTSRPAALQEPLNSPREPQSQNTGPDSNGQQLGKAEDILARELLSLK